MNTDEYLKGLDSPMREIVVELRGIVKGVSADIVEDIKWGVPTYALVRSFCSIMAHKKHVNLQIFQGANLEGGEDLVGTGKNMRHLKFSNVADIRAEVVRRYLERAVKFEHEHT